MKLRKMGICVLRSNESTIDAVYELIKWGEIKKHKFSRRRILRPLYHNKYTYLGNKINEQNVTKF